MNRKNIFQIIKPRLASRQLFATLALPIAYDQPLTAEQKAANSNKGTFVFRGIREDFKRRLPHYVSDWTDGLKKKTVAAVLFMYFACLAPTVAFGGLTNLITNGSMGVIEFLISTGASGMFYSIFSGQPMTFLGPTGLTLAFTGALYKFTSMAGLPFLPLYSWTGMWTSLFLALCAVFNVSSLIKYCTRFTDDCFNALLALNFLYEAGK
jgi:hypothetical protein